MQCTCHHGRTRRRCARAATPWCATPVGAATTRTTTTAIVLTTATVLWNPGLVGRVLTVRVVVLLMLLLRGAAPPTLNPPPHSSLPPPGGVAFTRERRHAADLRDRVDVLESLLGSAKTTLKERSVQLSVLVETVEALQAAVGPASGTLGGHPTAAMRASDNHALAQRVVALTSQVSKLEADRVRRDALEAVLRAAAERPCLTCGRPRGHDSDCGGACMCVCVCVRACVRACVRVMCAWYALAVTLRFAPVGQMTPARRRRRGIGP